MDRAISPAEYSPNPMQLGRAYTGSECVEDSIMDSRNRRTILHKGLSVCKIYVIKNRLGKTSFYISNV